jgi:hypothetical protein
MRRGFADPDYLVPMAILCVLLALLMPLIARCRHGAP